MIIKYFNEGFTYSEIEDFFAVCKYNTVSIFRQHLIRTLQKLALNRKKLIEDSSETICGSINEEIYSSGYPLNLIYGHIEGYNKFKPHQQSLRPHHNDSPSSLRSFIKSKSTSSQRIESYWSQLTRHSIKLNWIIQAIYAKEVL